MGIDYTAPFGLGYKIKPRIDEDDENTYMHTPDGVLEDMFDFRRYVSKSSKYIICEIGNRYDDDDTEYYIFIKNPFDSGYNLEKEIETLDEYCNEMGIDTLSKFDCYGGLCVS